jgi:RNA polymerase sigma-70 factor (ECF subfamily)
LFVNRREPIQPDLLRRAQAGEAEAFDRLVDDLTPSLYRIARRMAADGPEAEAIVQETWIRAWKHRGRLDPARPALAWLARIAVNLSRDQWRKRRPIDFADLGGDVEDREDESETLDQRLEVEEARERLARAVEALRPEWRMILALRYDGGLAYDEIAEALAVPLNTVRTHLRRAHQTLRRRLEVDDG